MAKVHTVHRGLRLLSFGFALSLFVFLSGVVGAANYGSGDYGACNFEDGCATSSASTPDTQIIELEPDKTDVILNSYDAFFVDAGITITNLKVGDVLSFCLSSSSCITTSEDSHTITIKGLDLSDPDNPILTLTFASSPFDVTFVMGDAKKIDVDQDGVEDIEVTFVDVVDDHAILTTKNLIETNNTVSNTEEIVAQKSSNVWLWVGAVVLIIMVVIVLIRFV